MAFLFGRTEAAVFADHRPRAIGVGLALAVVGNALAALADLPVSTIVVGLASLEDTLLVLTDIGGRAVLIGGTFVGDDHFAPAVVALQTCRAVLVVVAADGLRAKASHTLRARRTFLVALAAIEEGGLTAAGDGRRKPEGHGQPHNDSGNRDLARVEVVFHDLVTRFRGGRRVNNQMRLTVKPANVLP